jgi:hypothetical protein
MPGTHFSLRLTEEEIAALASGAIEELAHRLARRVCGPMPGREIVPPEGTTGDAGTAQDIATASDAGTDARGEALAHLHMLVHLQQAVALLEDRAAEEAAAAGAGYPQIGRACNISRQGARRRWPGLVGTEATHHPPRRTDRTRSR